jgi:hypothetical protein
MALNKILEQLKANRVYAEEDVSQGNPSTQANRIGRKNAAREEVKRLKEDYITELRLSSAFILVTGSAKEEFLNLATSEFGCFSTDPEGFYNGLANEVSPTLYANKSGSVSLFEILGRHLEDKAYDLQIVGYPQLLYKQEYNRMLKTKEDLKNLIKESVNDQVGPEIAGLHMIRAISDEAIKRDHANKITPIILATDDEKLILDLVGSLGRIGSRGFMVVAGKGSKAIRSTEGAFTVKEVSAENVKNILTQVKGLCR